MFLKFTLYIISAFLLTQCAKVTEPSMRGTHKSERLASPYTMPAAAYLALAKNQAGEEKQALLLLASGRLIYDGSWREGLAVLSQTENLSPELLSEKKLLQAKADLIQGQPSVAVAKLSGVLNIHQLPIYYQVQFHEMLALAYQSLGNAPESVVEREKLETLLPDEVSRSNNRRALWLTLTTLPMAELDTLIMESKDRSQLKGWLQLAMISRKPFGDPKQMLEEVVQWQSHFPNHPGNYILPSPLVGIAPHLFSTPRQTALLLPLTGPLAGPGMAIKDGFMAALQASDTGTLMTVRFYNTDSANVSELYQQAISEGADYVVGPLTKPNVAQIAGIPHPVPTLLLNDTEGKSPLEGAYQFGLSPGNEAQQVAAKARKGGYTRALVIAPTGVWGDEVVAAFADQWGANGGRIVDRLHYGAKEDMNILLRDFLQISDSNARANHLKRLLGSNIESTSNRRQDFDMIFLLAYPTQARQIMPLLKYYYAGDVPVYATSAVYGGSADPMKDKDLDGIIFCDMPWVFAHQMGNRNWPEQLNSYNRLYALGMDGFALSRQLNQLLLFPAMGVSDNSGVLYLTASQQIARILVFGQFQHGLAQLLKER